MNKSELINFMSELTGNSKVDAEKALNWVVDSMIAAITRKNSINLVGFGSFHIQERKAREGRNPKTGQSMHIPAYNQPVFRAGKKMKDACNS
jgi:DNA-binding protein HU-beta